MTTFQPTLPARGATVILDVIIRVPYFNPRSPHGERPDIRTSHGKKGNFNPRSPHGERQKPPTERGKNYDISTHAPRTGSDSKGARFSLQKNHFNPRSPHGERPQTDDNGISGDIFQPTLPARGATDAKEENSGFFLTISTHAPRTGSDTDSSSAVYSDCISTHAPRTGSDHSAHHSHGDAAISTHAPRTGSDGVLR